MPTREEMLRELLALGVSPKELRVMAYESKTHVCTGKLYTCCAKHICESCLTLHLESSHSGIVRDTVAYFSSKKQLVQGEKEKEVLTLCGRVRKNTFAKAKHEQKCLDCAERMIDPLAKQPHGFLSKMKATRVRNPNKAMAKEKPVSNQELLDSMTLEQLEELIAKRKLKLEQ